MGKEFERVIDHEFTCYDCGEMVESGVTSKAVVKGGGIILSSHLKCEIKTKVKTKTKTVKFKRKRKKQ